jgi:hypothetical protein
VYDQDTDSYQAAVTIIELASGNVVGGGPVVLGGSSNYSTLNSDATRLYEVTTDGDQTAGTSTTSFTSIDLADGSVVGEPATINGQYRSVSFNQDKTQAYVTTVVHDTATNTDKYYVTVVNSGEEPDSIAV